MHPVLGCLRFGNLLEHQRRSVTFRRNEYDVRQVLGLLAISDRRGPKVNKALGTLAIETNDQPHGVDSCTPPCCCAGCDRPPLRH